LSVIYLVRHAHADWTPDENRPLSKNGSADAIRLAEILRGYPIRAIYSSPFRRAYQTISPLAERLGLSIQTELDLRERKLGDGAFEDFFKAVEVKWRDSSFAHSGGESSTAAQKRGIAVMQRLFEKHPAEHIAISTHGNLLALILQEFDPSVDFAFWESMTMPDIFAINFIPSGETKIRRLWREGFHG